MTVRRFTGARSRARALAAAAALDAADPRVGRCSHGRWAVPPRVGKGRVMPCLCAAVDDPHPDCPWVTWQAAVVVRTDAGATLLHGASDDDDLTDDERDAVPDEPPARAAARARRAR